MYPGVFRDFYDHWQQFGNIHYLPTPAFFYGLHQGEEILVKLQRGKTISIRYVYRSRPDDNGNCKVTFELNGQARSVQIRDESAAPKKKVHRKAVESNEIGAPLMGRLASVLVKPGDKVSKDSSLFVIEAMKMETTITAPGDREVKAVHLDTGTLVEQGDLVVEFA
jgi:pyruvate carboxylase